MNEFFLTNILKLVKLLESNCQNKMEDLTMNRINLVILCTLLTVNLSMAQWSGYSHTTEGSELDAGLGMTWIDNQAYYTLTFQPDISIGKLGIGLGVNILYNPDEGRVEMYLISLRNQDIQVNNTAIFFTEGESIFTESSYKFSLNGFKQLAEAAGFQVKHVWTDRKQWFSVQYLVNEL